MSVRRIDSRDARWEAFVRGNREALVYHLPAWSDVLEATYRSRPVHLALFDGDRVRGLLPLMERRGLLTGRRLRSLPTVPVAGPLGGHVELVASARELAASMGVPLAVNTRVGGLEREVEGMGTVPVPPTWILPLPDDWEALRARWPRGRNLGRSVRRAESAGLRFREGPTVADVRIFYRLYVRTMRRLGVLPRALGQLLLAREALGGDVFRLFLVEQDGEAIAGAVFHHFNGTLELLYNGSDERRLDVRPNHGLYAGAMRWAMAHGDRWFDFGYAWPDGPLGRFKAQWSAEPVAQHLYVAPPTGSVPGLPGAASRRRRAVSAVVGRSPASLLSSAGTVAYRYL